MSKRSSPATGDLQKKIRIAEAAVSKVSDPSLKPVAFQTILARLLSEETESEKKKTVQRDEKSEPKPAKKRQLPKGAQGRTEELITEGFFDHKQPITEIKKELVKHGWNYPLSQLAPVLIRLVRFKKLRRIAEPSGKGGKVIWHYSKW